MNNIETKRETGIIPEKKREKLMASLADAIRDWERYGEKSGSFRAYLDGKLSVIRDCELLTEEEIQYCRTLSEEEIVRLWKGVKE